MTIDITPEAVERLACILEGRGGFVKDTFVVATLRALSSALTASQAETAAAYGIATHYLDKWATNLRDLNFPNTAPIVEQCSAMIRALTTADSKAALDRMIAEARADGMREAVSSARQALVDGAYIRRGSHQETPTSVMFLAERLISNAILAAISKGKDHE